MKENYVSTYDIKLDQIKALGGDNDKNKYDSVYQAELEMLRLLEEGGHSGEGVTPAQVRAIVEGYNYTTMPQVEAKKYSTEDWVLSQGYLTEHQSLDGYATENWVENQGYLTEHQQLKTINNQSIIGTGNIEIGGETSGITEAECRSIVEGYDYATKGEIPSLDGYATENWVENKGYLTEHQSLAGYATENFVTSQGYLTEHQSLAGYATENWVTSQGFLTEHQSLDDYALKSEIPSLDGYATESFVTSQGYITMSDVESQGYATESFVTSQGYLTEIPSEYVTESDLESKNYTTLATVESQGYLKEIPAIYAKVVMCTQAEYDALETKDDHTLYIIIDAE